MENMNPSYYMWKILDPGLETVRRRLARAFGCDPEEIAVTRNASEALEIVQLGMDLKPGDEVVTTNQDYPRMIATWLQRERRDGPAVDRGDAKAEAALGRLIGEHVNSGGMAIVLVTATSLTGDAMRRSTAGPDSSAWVAQQ